VISRSRTGGCQHARVVAHVHSEWSDDASWTLREIAATFARLRYHVVLMSEHSRGFTAAKWQEYAQACREASTDRLILVPGVEYGDESDVIHVPVWGDLPFFGEAIPIGRLLPQVSEAGGSSVWAHPWRREAWRHFEPPWLSHLTAVEVWNRKYDGLAPSRDALALARRERLRPAVALDFHTRRQLFPLGLSLELDGSPSEAAVYAALAAGRFSARAFGLPIAPFTRGPGGSALRGLEQLRKAAARVLP
jgi:predicted Rdx family selenoprotein